MPIEPIAVFDESWNLYIGQQRHVLTSSEHNEWGTPPFVIEMARKVMGSIDLDPASNALAQQWIRAERYFCAEDDGLSQVWGGNVWLNPPYGKVGNRSQQDVWFEYLLSQPYRKAIILTKAVPGYLWWTKYFRKQIPVCITDDCLSFVNMELLAETGEISTGKSKTASCIWYLGNGQNKFAEVFDKIGRIV